MGIFAAGNLRHPIARAAPFWSTATILLVGVLWGVSMAAAVFLLSGRATTSPVLRISLMLLGLLAVQYVGFQPLPEDIYRKSEQTGTVAAGCYLIVAVGMTIYSCLH